jgi:hypothetical protein
MMSPTQAMAWQIWRGWRWGLLLGWAYMLVAAAVALFLPGILRRAALAEANLQDAGQQLALPCAFILIHLAAVFSLTGADMKEKGYWKTKFVLPVQTRTLVAWPMIWGCLALGCVWLFAAILILRPTGNAVPLVWPTCALAVGLTLLQALSWMPLAQQWLSIVIAVPLILIVAMVVVLVAAFEVPEPIATGIFAGLLPLTYVACLRSVALDRQGDKFDWGLWNRLVAWAAEWRKPAEHPFRSAARAQLWFECRSFAWSLPLFIALLVPFQMAVAVLQERSDFAESCKRLAILLLVPAGLATFLGSQLGNASFPFVATRPLSSASLVRSKFEMALVSALAASIPVLLVVPLFFIWPSFRDSALQAARSAGTPKTAMILLLAAVFPVLLTWKGLVESLWIGLTGRAWLINTIPLAIAALIGCGILFGLWVLVHPDWQTYLWSLTPWLIGLMLIVKLIVAAWVLYSLIRLRLVTPTAAGLMIGTWSIVVLCLCLIVFWLAPGQLLSGSMVVGIALLVPLSRLAGAPLALDWNRHQ